MLSVRPTTLADLPALSELFAEGFGRPLSAAEWQWKYQQLPGAARSLVAVAAGGELVAHVGAYALPARWRGGEGLAWELADFVGRRRGLRPPLVVAGRRLLAELPGDGDLPWIFGFPSSRHLALGERVFGYRWLPPIVPWAGELPGAGGEGGVEIAIGDRGGAWAAQAWEECAVDGVRRSVEFLDWRYWARPDRYYRFYRLEAGGRTGLAVASFVAREAWLAELWLPPGPDWAPALRAVAADLRAAGFTGWRCWRMAGTEPLLRGLGLAPVAAEAVPCGCCGGRSGDDGVVDRAASLVYALGDYDAA